MRPGEGEPRACLVGLPPIGPARALPVRCRGDDGCIHHAREVDGPQPLLAREDAAIARWRVLRRRVRVGEVGRVGPGAADPDVGRAECARHGAQPRVGEVDRGTILVKVGAHPSGRATTLGIACGLVGGPGRRRRDVLVRLPEPAASHLQHLDVVGLIALVHRAHTLHRRGGELDNLILRLCRAGHGRKGRKRHGRAGRFPVHGFAFSFR